MSSFLECHFEVHLAAWRSSCVFGARTGDSWARLVLLRCSCDRCCSVECCWLRVFQWGTFEGLAHSVSSRTSWFCFDPFSLKLFPCSKLCQMCSSECALCQYWNQLDLIEDLRKWNRFERRNCSWFFWLDGPQVSCYRPLFCPLFTNHNSISHSCRDGTSGSEFMPDSVSYWCSSGLSILWIDSLFVRRHLGLLDSFGWASVFFRSIHPDWTHSSGLMRWLGVPILTLKTMARTCSSHAWTSRQISS